MTKDEARQLAQVAMALGSAAVAEALYDAWQKGRGAGLTEAASMATAQARVLRQAADPQHEADEGRRNNLARKAFAVEQVTRQIEARREVLHFVFCNKDPRRDYLACAVEISGTASTANWDRVTCPECLAFRPRWAR